MSRKSSAKGVAAASLVRTAPEVPAFPALDRTGRKLQRGLADFFSTLLASQASVAVSPVRIEGRPVSEGIELRHIRLKPFEGTSALAVEREAIVRLVDIYYGGDGVATGERTKLSFAEERLLTRIASAICEILPAAWNSYASIAAELDEDVGSAASAPAAAQAFTVSWPDRPDFTIECRFPIAMLETVPQIKSDTPVRAEQGAGDEDWQARLTQSALSVGFPVRAIFAEPELPLAMLMNLQAGDVIPVCLPSEIDLMVSGRRLARGQAGESNGRAAISICQI